MREIILEWDGREYPVRFEIVDFIENGAKGQYIPDDNKILLLKNCDNSTVYHESIHAVIDMFRSTKEDFSELFELVTNDNGRKNYGEEAFCHYACQLATQIISSINESKK